MTNPERPGKTRLNRIFDSIRSQRKLVFVSLLSMACLVAAVSLSGFAWRTYLKANMIPVAFETGYCETDVQANVGSVFKFVTEPVKATL